MADYRDKLLKDEEALKKKQTEQKEVLSGKVSSTDATTDAKKKPKHKTIVKNQKKSLHKKI